MEELFNPRAGLRRTTDEQPCSEPHARRRGRARGICRSPITAGGRATIAQFLVAVTPRFTPPGARFSTANVNGKPTLLGRRADGTTFLVVSIDTDAGGIRTIWAIANPDKLKAV